MRSCNRVERVKIVADGIGIRLAMQDDRTPEDKAVIIEIAAVLSRLRDRGDVETVAGRIPDEL